MSDVAALVRVSVSNYSALQKERLSYVPELPPALAAGAIPAVVKGEVTSAPQAKDEAALRSWFPHTYPAPLLSLEPSSCSPAPASATPSLRVGVVFCGRQSPGGHNVVCGLHSAVTARGGVVVGIAAGTKGLFERRTVHLSEELLSGYSNQGGYHLLGRSVDKIRTPTEMQAALGAVRDLDLSGLVLIGGTYTCTDAAHLAEYFAAAGQACAVVGVPVTIDGDLRNQFVETTVGFDTATRVYSQLVGNMATDGNSAKKYYYFVRVMGRSSSHVGLEVALQTHPNVVLLAEDIARVKSTLTDIVRSLADTVCARAEAGKNFGVVLVPEGVLTSIPEIRALIGEMNAAFSEGVVLHDAVVARLTPWSAAVLAYLPSSIRSQLFLERESSGAVQLSQISTERLLAELVGDELARRKAAGKYKGKYASICHFFGYQARCSTPTNFDCAYGSSLGATAAALVAAGANGYMATVSHLNSPGATLRERVKSWTPVGVPLTAMLTVPAAPARPFIDTAVVDVHGGAYAAYLKCAADWAAHERYGNPGPLQFHGPIADDLSLTLTYEKHDYLARIKALKGALETITDICRVGVRDSVLDAALTGATSLAHILTVMKERQ